MGSQRVVHDLVTKQQLHRQLVIASSKYTLVMFFHHERLVIWGLSEDIQNFAIFSSGSKITVTTINQNNNKPKPFADPFPCLSGPWRALEHLQLLLVLGCRYPWWHLTTTLSPPGTKTARQQLHSSTLTPSFCWHSKSVLRGCAQ